MDDIKRILVVSRSTKNCKKALHYGIALAKQYNSKLSVLHVIHDPFSVDGWNLPVPSLKQEYGNLVKKAREEIDRIIKSEQADGLEITEWIREGKPVEEVIEAVKDKKIDLVIISAHEEGRLEHYLFGRTVEELTRKMPCSILLVKYNPWHKV
ncbi:MAG: universal stress protein [Desulfobacterales bacterium]|nr:MAG: universal stress protein [Desulfobacterales bacterium]